jgi:hypothetical protein
MEKPAMLPRILFLSLLTVLSSPTSILAADAEVAPCPALEIDHAYLWSSKSAEDVTLLRDAGFTGMSSSVNLVGQGTTSRILRFQNFYLEFIFLDEAISIDPGFEKEMEDRRRRTSWRTSGASPIGVAWHARTVGPLKFPWPVHHYRATWMPSGEYLTRFGTADDVLAPRLFAVPEYLAWRADKVATQSKTDGSVAKALEHATGVERLTHIRIHAPSRALSNTLKQIVSCGLVEFREESEPALELTFDERSRGRTHDFRPRLPLVINW